MEALSARLETIIHKLNQGIRFGLYDSGSSCYFEDGTKVNYHELWAAIRIVNKLSTCHKKTLFELYPDLFMGTFPYKFSKYRVAYIFLIELLNLGKQKPRYGYLPQVSIPNAH